MAKTLYVQTSPRGDQSFSIQIARKFLDRYQALHPADTVETLDLFTADLPLFDAPAAAAKYAVIGGQAPVDAAGRVWKKVIDVINHFKGFDKYVLSSPMWNFGIPYRLKQYFDILVQPALTFAYSPEKGYSGLVTGKPIMLCLARGGEYGPGKTPLTFDMQKGYLEMILQFIGFTDIRCLIVQPTLSGAEAAQKTLAAAIEQAKKAAGSF